MTATNTNVDPASRYGAPSASDSGISVFGLAAILVRWRWRIAALAFAFGVLGFLIGITSPKLYQSSAVFVPQGSDNSQSGLALAAGQLGFRIPASGGSWGPPTYIELLRSRALLEPLALDTVTVVEEGNRRIAVMDLLGIRTPSPALRLEETIDALRGIVSADEVRTIAGVRLAVTTEWPSASQQMAAQLLKGVNDFNLQTRRTQSSAERQFADAQVQEAEQKLRDAEDRLQRFLEANRIIASPDLMISRDRLQREVLLRQQIYTSLLQIREEARVKEVRDTPVITVIEEPRVPVMRQPRGSVQKAVLGGFAGAVLGALLALLAHGLIVARRGGNPEVDEFFKVVDEARAKLPRLSRRA